MAVRIQLRRGNNSEFSGSLQLAAGEVALVEDEKVLIVGDGTSTYNDLKAAGKFINYQTDQGLGVVGGANATGETPLTVKGVGSQTAAILKVTDSGDSAILQIFDDEGPTVRLEDHGATNEVFMLLKQQASGTANALELKDSGDTNQMTISCDGEVAITPTNNQTADAPSLDVKGSAATQSNGILRVQASDGSTNLFRVLNDSTNILKASVFGSTPSPDHTDPAFFGQIQTATTPNNTDSGATGDAVVDFPHFKMVSVGSGTQIRGKIELAGNSAAATFNALAVVKNGATPFTQAEIDYSGKGAFRDVEITQTGRSIADASVLRADEIYARIVKQVAPFTFGVQGALVVNTDVTTTERLARLTGSDGDNARKLNVSDPENVGSAFTLESASVDTTVPETSTENDLTNPYFVKVPANSGPFTIMANVYYIGGLMTTRIYQYTSDAAESTGRVTIAEDTGSVFNQGGASSGQINDYSLLQLTANVANETTDKFYAVSFVTDSTSGLDEIATNGVDPIIFALHDEHVNSENTNNQPDGTRQFLTFFRGTPTAGSANIFRIV